MKIKKTLSLLIVILICSGTIAIAATKVSPIDVLKSQVKTLQTKLTAYFNANKSLNAQVNQLNITIANYKKTVSVTEDAGKMYMDGVSIGGAKFANINGTRYVSVDNIISALTNKTDAEFKYVESKKELYIGAMPVDGEISLTNLQYYASGSWRIQLDKWSGNENEFIINRKKYYKGIGFYNTPVTGGSWGDFWIQYKPNCEYKTLKFKVGIDDQTIGTGYKGGITVIGDGNVLYDSGLLEAQEDAVEQTINISNIKLLEIKGKGNEFSHIIMADPILIP